MSAPFLDTKRRAENLRACFVSLARTLLEERPADEEDLALLLLCFVEAVIAGDRALLAAGGRCVDRLRSYLEPDSPQAPTTARALRLIELVAVAGQFWLELEADGNGNRSGVSG